MDRFVKGDIVVVPFPFSNISQSKKRPALVIANIEGSDLILSQITSQSISDSDAIRIVDNDFDEGSLMKTSNIRPNKIFTADKSIILYRAGHLTNEKTEEVTNKLVEILKR